jgi:hypothetical protein
MRSEARIVASRLVACVAPRPPGGASGRLITFAAFAIGSALSFVWLVSIAGYGTALAAAAASTVLYAAAVLARPIWVRRVTTAALLLVHAAHAFVAVSLGVLLAWTLPLWLIAFIAILLAAVFAGAIAKSERVRLPLCLPVGLWIVGLLIGWLREDGRVRCEDYHRATSNPAVSLQIPSAKEILDCTPDETLVVGRYPRRIWLPPSSDYVIFTTQPGELRFWPTGRQVQEPLGGSICSADLQASDRPHCIGSGKAQGIAESIRHRRLFVTGWGDVGPGMRGTLYAVSGEHPVELLAEKHFPERTGELYYDEEADLLGLLSDEGKNMIPVRGSNLEPEELQPAPIPPGATHYDTALGEGVFCFAAGPLRTIDGAGFVSVAFRGAPFSLRPLAPTTRYLSSWLASTWGCDWDSRSRRVYVAVANLGLLLTIDYDSGEVIDRNWIGFGIRSIALDRERRRLYLGDFLRGRVIEWDVRQARVVRDWFAGRFVRHLLLSRDRSSLFASSNLGIVEIRLRAP